MKNSLVTFGPISDFHVSALSALKYHLHPAAGLEVALHLNVAPLKSPVMTVMETGG